MTTIPLHSGHIPESKTTLLILVETRHLVLLKRGNRYYVTLPTLAGLMTRTPYEGGLGTLSYLLEKVSDDLPAHSILQLSPNGKAVKMAAELVALSLPAARTVLSRSNMRDMLALHDLVLKQFEALYAPSLPEIQE